MRGEAAQKAKRNPAYADTFARLAHRRGKKIATTAIARKLLARVWHVLSEAEQAARTQEAPTPLWDDVRDNGRVAPIPRGADVAFPTLV
ncbi:hypothetical protein [Streptomyces sp. NPDC001315]|uniref:hypothetical protein n=1 Tax=Streptomyces sp. NPDC001315 TaxID=3364562 RepID=UPI0036C6906F